MTNGLYKNLREKLTYQETLDLEEEGVRELLRDLLDKESAMKPLIINNDCTCLMCGVTIAEMDEYCWKCGRKLGWEDD